jgi:reductive dehalogenase
MPEEEQEKRTRVSRRKFLAAAGLAGAAAQAGGFIAGGVAAGKDSETYTGWESFNPGTQFFDRTPFEFEGPAHSPVSAVRRPSHLTDYVFGRVARFRRGFQQNPDWTLDDPVEDLGFPPELVEFYKKFPERLEWDFRTFSETIPNHRQDQRKYANYYKLAEAYSTGFVYHGSNLPEPQGPPEESDFSMIPMGPGAGSQTIGEPIPFKSPDLAAEFIKEIAHRFGATLVGITRTKSDFLYDGGWRGCPDDYDFSRVPAHWEYAIVIGVPMEWDVVLASPQASTSYDAYDRVSTAAIRLEGSLKSLGYPARSHTPMTDYDLIVPPHAVEAGLGEVGRPGFCITPEAGGNCRMAIVTTNLPMTIDKPIDYGVAEFCSKCKICAEQCPSGAISLADSPEGLVIRGYEHWYINNGACYNFWRESMGPMGCRLCVAVCPYSRKDNWMHGLARTVDSRDPTGVASTGLLWMQKDFFDYPDAAQYRRPPDGHFESYRREPHYLKADRYLDIDIVSPREED